MAAIDFRMLDTSIPQKLGTSLFDSFNQSRNARLQDTLGQQNIQRNEQALQMGDVQMKQTLQNQEKQQKADAYLNSPEGQQALGSGDINKFLSGLASTTGLTVDQAIAFAKEQAAAKKADRTVVAPGSTVLEGNTPVFTAPSKPENPSNLSRLVEERESLDPSDPRRKIYDNAIRKESETAAQIVPRVNLSIGDLISREAAKAEGRAQGEAKAAGVVGSKAWEEAAATKEGKAQTAQFVTNSLDAIINNIDQLIDENGNPKEGFNAAFGQIDAMFPNWMKFDKTSTAGKTLDAVRSQETMRGLAEAKQRVGQSFGSMQVKEWDRFTNLYKNIDPDQPQSSLAKNLKDVRDNAIKLKQDAINGIDAIERKAPPAEAINMLRKYPNTAAKFDAIFGDGASQEYLNQ